MDLKPSLSSLPGWQLQTPVLANPTMSRILLPLLIAGAMGMGGLVALGGPSALFVCISLLVLAFVLRDFRVGVVLVVILTPISTSAFMPHSIGGVTGLNPFNLLLLEALAAALLSGVSLWRLAPRPLVWLYVVPVVLAGIVGAQHVNEIPAELMNEELLSFTNVQGYFRDVLIKPMLIVVVALLVAAAATRTKRPERLLLPLLVSVCAMCLLSILFVMSAGASLEMLASSQSREFFLPLGIHANDLGRLYTFAYALLLFSWAQSRSGLLKLVLGLGMLLTVAALLFTFSRSAFFGFVLVNCLFLLSRGNITGLLLGAIFLVLFVLALPGVVFDRVTLGWDQGLNAISAGRVDDIWLPLLPEFWRHPLVGNGLGSIAWSDAMRAGRILVVTHPHNAFLQTVMDMGVLGLAMMCAYFTHVWLGFRRLSRDPDTSPLMRGFYGGAGAGLLSLMISGISGGSLMPGLEQSFLWLTIGMMYGHRRGTGA